MRSTPAAVALTCLLLSGSISGQEGQETEPPRDVGLREETGRRLAQIDVSVRGPEEAIRSLTRDDFELRVAGRKVDDFTVDRLCRETVAQGMGL